ncbi:MULTISPECIES: hypothetical protein [Corynebacterium]|nr:MULTISPECIES: hypothetical protein [Corynebacterium]WJZ13555.1 hypothetical protein CGOTT_08180 [Corynebacterium gottingense]WJZ15873.1 hypothetical protein CGOTTB_08145 [Corynebacterium gottingense]
MAQEQFAGPDYFTEFDPEKFIRDLKIQASAGAESENDAEEHSDAE